MNEDTESGLAPYARIVADIRSCIDTGELRPGDRVPSTREITRRWGVAMATATKALTVLRREGRVEAVRGVGTVVRGAPVPDTGPAPDLVDAPAANRGERERPRERRSHPEPHLTREGIVRAAIAIADTEGIEGLSMRRVSTELRVSTMALYRHVESKGELLTEMVDHLYTVDALPEPPPDDWRRALEVALLGEWEIYRRHPWAARLTVMAGGVLSPGLMRNGEWMMRVIVSRGHTPDEALRILTIVSAYTSGMALQVTRVALEEHEVDMDAEHWWNRRGPRLHRLIAEGAYPTMLGVSGPPDVHGIFEAGMRRLLDGLTPLMEGEGTL
ncbi:TetR/AcrR family transcriptional regulator C-terminal domain-containing protein [Nocardiopsis alba]|uniref:Bacterial regulatory s, tetR family protein n=1 Tax=Nocardiopsis alba (strain ATCC BAA-2165 / BE74) TaxID=1205910 RepID=J7L3H5_NOCAA|nr:GntR family transcriptional regulator [Nocardiopsis alba]AFR08193.1 bacterial regulatory s, tetR family protein [Nocardiopsis alba ATCC BAA-2165]